MKRIAVMVVAAGVLHPGAHAWAQTEPIRIVITKVDCSRLVRHQPAPDVAYRPGVDARGRAVVPADIPGSGADAIPNLLPEVLEFPLTINPVAYGARNQAQRDKAAASQGMADTQAGKMAAQARMVKLTDRKTALDANAAALAAQKAAADADYAAAASRLAALQAEVDGGMRPRHDRDYVHARDAMAPKQQAVGAKQAEIDANAANLAATANAIAAQQAIIDAAPEQEARYAADKQAAEARLAGISAKGLDSTTMTVGTVRYDMSKGTFTLNGQPLGSAEQEELARACQKQGVR